MASEVVVQTVDDAPRPPAAKKIPVVGELTAAVFAGLSRIRGSRIVHPKGAGFEAQLLPTRAAPDGVELFADGMPRRALVRLSRSVGLPSALPDPCGVAIRIPDAYGAGRDQDLLLVSSGRAPVVRHALVPRKRFEGGFYSSLLPFRFGAETVMLGASTQSDGNLGFHLELASPLGPWRSLARLELGAPLPAEQTERICFNPWHTGGGIEPIGFLNDLRSPAYRGSQRGRSARQS